MREFRLPHTRKALRAREVALKHELSRRQTEYQLAWAVLPRGTDPRKTPEFYRLLVAHRRWQHAYEKLLLMTHREASSGAFPFFVALPNERA